MTEARYAPARDTRGVLVDQRMHWFVEVLAADGRGFGDDAGEHFVQAFLDRCPDGLDAQLDAWRALGPFTVESYTPVAHKGWAALVGPDGTRHTLAMTVDTTGLIRRVEIEPEVLRHVPREFADLDAALAREHVTSAVLVCRRDGDTWTSLHERRADAVMPTGSAFKIYVLLALARAVRDGTVRWDDEIVLRPRERSLPTGEMQDLPDGATATVYETAYNMFARSDNTASDMILNHVGRDAVERAVADAGHHDPGLLTPFPTSHELFEIGWGSGSLLDEWSRADTAGRADVLARIDGPLTARIQDLTTTAYDRGLDWFMTARDLANALHALWRERGLDATGRLREILAAYPGVHIDRERWPVSLFKGGSTPGVVMFCWLVVDHDDVEHAVVLLQSADRVGILGNGLPLRRSGDLIIHSLIR